MLRVWTKRYYMVLPSGKKYWRFYSRKHGGTLAIEYKESKEYPDTDSYWLVTFEPTDLMKEEFYPPNGLGSTLKEAIQDFRKEMNSTRKRFDNENA